MYKLYYIERDTTLYEKYPERNTGLDSILELTKIACGSRDDMGNVLSNTYNTRVLLDLGNNVTTLRTDVNNGTIPAFASHPLSSSAYLTLRLADANSIPANFSIEAYPISESWTMGTGTFDSDPEARVGASWYYRNGTDVSLPLAWNTGSAQSAGQESVTNSIGGGAWLTSSADNSISYRASQSFSNAETIDVRLNITAIMNAWISNDISNHGLIIKWPTAVETSGDLAGSLKFFGRESNTIYVPKLEVAYDNSILSGTGSFTEINSNVYVPYFTNLRSAYHEFEKAKLRIQTRPEFPTRTYQTSSVYLDNYRLPTSSYWSVLDSVTDETIIPFDTGSTRISCDSVGNYINIDFNSFLTERYYKLVLRVEREGGDDVQIHDNRYYFRVDR
jgi:hypothetical protein